MADGRLILVCGLPGSGKTTLARRLAAERPGVFLCGDDWMTGLGFDLFDVAGRARLNELFRQLARELLVLGDTVILESGFARRSGRDEARRDARALGVAVELRVLDVPVDELWARIVVRNSEPPWREAPMTRVQFDRERARFQPPDAAELDRFDDPLVRPAPVVPGP